MEKILKITLDPNTRTIICKELKFAISSDLVGSIDVVDCITDDTHVYILMAKKLFCFDICGKILATTTITACDFRNNRLILIGNHPVVINSVSDNKITMYNENNGLKVMSTLQIDDCRNCVINFNGEIILAQTKSAKFYTIESAEDRLVLVPFEDTRFSFTDDRYLVVYKSTLMFYCGEHNPYTTLYNGMTRVRYDVKYLSDEYFYGIIEGNLVKILMPDVYTNPIPLEYVYEKNTNHTLLQYYRVMAEEHQLKFAD